MTQTATPLIGLGFALSIGTQGGTPTYTVVNGIKTFKMADGSWGTEDVTVLNTAAFSRRFIKTLEDAGEAEVSMLWDSADPGQVLLLAAYAVGSNSANGADFPIKAAMPIDLAGGQTTTGDTFAFNGLVTKYKRPEVQVDKTLTWGVTIKVDGAVTLTEGA